MLKAYFGGNKSDREHLNTVGSHLYLKSIQKHKQTKHSEQKRLDQYQKWQVTEGELKEGGQKIQTSSYKI